MTKQSCWHITREPWGIESGTLPHRMESKFPQEFLLLIQKVQPKPHFHTEKHSLGWECKCLGGWGSLQRKSEDLRRPALVLCWSSRGWRQDLRKYKRSVEGWGWGGRTAGWQRQRSSTCEYTTPTVEDADYSQGTEGRWCLTCEWISEQLERCRKSWTALTAQGGNGCCSFYIRSRWKKNHTSKKSVFWPQTSQRQVEYGTTGQQMECEPLIHRQKCLQERKIQSIGTLSPQE